MNVNIELGNIWDMFSAIGTVGAVVLSLYIVRKENKSKIDILYSSEFKTYDSDHGTKQVSLDTIIQVSAYNSGKTTVGISFVGFGVGIKKKSLFRRIVENSSYDIATYIKTIDNMLETPKIELIGTGQITEVHQINWNYLYETSNKYLEENGDLLVLAHFKDFNGKSYYAKIRMANPS